MRLRSYSILLIGGLLFAAGCRKSESPENPPASTVTNSSATAMPAAVKGEAVARLYWVGKRRLAADTNSTDLMAIWNVPEGLKLEEQTLDKISTAPWRLLNRPADASASAALRPLVEDLLQEEFYLEVRGETNQPMSAVLAIRVSDERAGLWQTNLGSALQSLTGIQPIPRDRKSSGWALKKQDPPKVIELTRAGHWTLIGVADASNDLVAMIGDRIQKTKAPYDLATNYWLNAEIDLPRLAKVFAPGWKYLSYVPKLTATATGDGKYVRTRGELNFSIPLNLQPEPWNFPTNLFHGDPSVFTAIRGIKSWLESSSAWKNWVGGPAPNQLFLWGVPGLPAQIYLAIPSDDPTNRVEQLSTQLLEKSPSWFITNDIAGFERSKQFHGVTWKGVPYLYPFVRSVDTNGSGHILAGTVLVVGDDTPPILEVMKGYSEHSNQVYYDREFTGGQIEQWLFISQYVRHVTKKAQLPAQSAGLLWLKAIVPVTGSSGTDILLTGPSQLSFTRISGSGFTAVELNLIADWLESPQFPFGLYSLLAPPPEYPQ
jgi:hypothetical protein